MDLGQSLKNNKSAYIWGGAAVVAGGLLLIGTAPAWVVGGIVAAGVVAVMGGMNADSIRPGALDFSAAPPPAGATKVAAGKTPAIEPQKLATLELEGPAPTPVNGKTPVQNARG